MSWRQAHTARQEYFKNPQLHWGPRKRGDHRESLSSAQRGAPQGCGGRCHLGPEKRPPGPLGVTSLRRAPPPCGRQLFSLQRCGAVTPSGLRAGASSSRPWGPGGAPAGISHTLYPAPPSSLSSEPHRQANLAPGSCSASAEGLWEAQATPWGAQRCPGRQRGCARHQGSRLAQRHLHRCRTSSFGT